MLNMTLLQPICHVPVGVPDAVTVAVYMLLNAETVADVAEVLANHQPEAAKPTKLGLHQAVQEHEHAASQVVMMTSLHSTEDIGMSAPQWADTQVNWAWAAAAGGLIVRGDKCG